MGRTPNIPEALKRGPFTLAEARGAGLERWHLEGASWRREGRGTYVWVGIGGSPIGQLKAASCRLPPEAAFSGLTAACLHGIDVSPVEPIEVTAPLVTRSGICVHHMCLDEAEVVRVRGLRATSIVRTLADLSARLDLVEAVVIADVALHKRLTSIAELSRWAAAHRGRAGIRKLKRVIDHAEPKAQSQMETRLRMLLVLNGLPRPKAQVPIYGADGRLIGYPDLYYDDAKLGIEYDGAVHRTSLADDNRRQNNMLRAGVRLLRFTGVDVHQNAESTLAHVRHALNNPPFRRTAGLPAA